MSDRYWRKIEDVENDIENAMQISSILLKLKGYDGDIEKIDTNENNISSNKGLIDINTSNISDNSGLISTNEGNISSNSELISINEENISSNLSKLNNIENNLILVDDIYNETFPISRFSTTTKDKRIFYRQIYSNFTTNGIIKIDAKFNYVYDENYTLKHVYRFYNNRIQFKKIELDHDRSSNVINDKFEIQGIDSNRIDIELYYENNTDRKKIELVGINTIQINYIENNSKLDINKNNISSNTGLINTNTSSISDNKDLIESNTGLINTNISTISDIEKGVELLIEPYNETFTFSNRTITTNRQILFEKKIDFDFSGLGVFNILTTCNYDKYNFTHEYHFLNNNELIFKKSIDVLSTEVKDKFKFKSIDTSSLKIILYLTDNDTNEKISLFGKNSLQFRYSKIKFKTDINENNIKTNLEKINEKSELIDTNKRDISFNLGLISNIKSNSTIIHDDIYNETFIFSNRTTTAQSQLIFKKIINFDFSNNGFFNILAVCNYDKKYNFNHKYRFFNNDELLKDVIIPMTSKNEFKLEGIGNVSSLKIELYITDNFNNETIKLLSNSSLQFKYSKIEFKTDINENNIKLNLGKITTNTSDISDNLGLINTNTSSISTNLGKINDNKDDIVALQTSNVKAFYNLDQIFIYDIENGYKNVDKDNHFHIFEKEIAYNFTKNSYLEIALKVLTEISNYVLIGFFQILCNFYDQDNNLFYTISLSTAAGSINRLSTIKSVFIVPINENMSKIKIDFFIAPKETQQNRSARFTIQDINSNKIYIKYFQKTNEMSIKDIQVKLKNIINILFYNDKKQIDFKNNFFDNKFNLNIKKDDFIEIDLRMLLEYTNIDNSNIIITEFRLYDDNDDRLYTATYNNGNNITHDNLVFINKNIFYNFEKDVSNLRVKIFFYMLRSAIVKIWYKPKNLDRFILKHYGN